MMDNLVTLCLVAVIIGAALLLLPRLMRGFGSNYRQRGNEMPHYDDPNIQSRGAFGRPAGKFGTTSSQPRQSSSPQRRYDNPNIQSRGSFGRSKNDD